MEKNCNYEKISQKIEYEDLTPNDHIKDGEEYLRALNWALNNTKIKNIALAGPYGAGKSSIIKTYLNQHDDIKSKSLTISLATFIENATAKKIDYSTEDIEIGILKQLFYKVKSDKIPQSRYRKIYKISNEVIVFWQVILFSIVSLFGYIFYPDTFNSIVDKIITAGSNLCVNSVLSIIIFCILLLLVFFIISIVYRSILSHFKIKEISIVKETALLSGDANDKNVFDRNIDEILYFFEEINCRFVFFEDLDRLGDSKIFVHLRELNTILNNYEGINESIIFIYAIKDDIFSNTDRTKFFDFIIPVIPIINSTNSEDILLEKIERSKNLGVEHQISNEFVSDVAPFITDMRILQNIYNEFITYKNTLLVEQDLNLLDEPMLALIIFKNIYPSDFAELQQEEGIVKLAFKNKNNVLKDQRIIIQDRIDKISKDLDLVSLETAKSIKELKLSLFSEICDWKGMTRYISVPGRSSIYLRDLLSANYDMKQLADIGRCTIYYRNWDFSGDYGFACNDFSNAIKSYLDRENIVKIIEESQIGKLQEELNNYEKELQNLSRWTLKEVIDEFGIDISLPEEVKQNKLLTFLLRRGYMDEKYVNYINYFKGESITKEDMNFLLSIKNISSLPYDYSLNRISRLVQKLQPYEFDQKEIYNFDLLEFLLSNHSDEDKDKMDRFITQLVDERDDSWKFIDGFIDYTQNSDYFITQLVNKWPNICNYILNNFKLTYQRKSYYLSLIFDNLEIEKIKLININNVIKRFIEENEDILLQLTTRKDKLLEIISQLDIKFRKIKIKNVDNQVLDYIFENYHYKINCDMLETIVEYKDKTLLEDLKTKNYSTIVKLNYKPLLVYVSDNFIDYMREVVLVEDELNDDVKDVVCMIEKSSNYINVCSEIIQREQFCIKNIEECCSELIQNDKLTVNKIWNLLLETNKVEPTWDNVIKYWAEFGFTTELVNFLDNHCINLKTSNSECLIDGFKNEFIISNVSIVTFKMLLRLMRLEGIDFDIKDVNKEKLLFMIESRYLEFNSTNYKLLSDSCPELVVNFIVTNQEKLESHIDNISMSSSLLENLLINDTVEPITIDLLIKKFAKQYITRPIAQYIKRFRLSVSIDLFWEVWKYLEDDEKQNFMYDNLNILDNDSMYKCFKELECYFSAFLDRSKKHSVELPNTFENRELAKKLESIRYITSYVVSEDRIIYRIKAIR